VPIISGVTTASRDTHLAQRIRQARGHVSQEELAYKIREGSKGKLTPASTDISRYERGVHAPRMVMLVAIARATGKDIEFFLNESDEADSDEEAALRTHAAEALSLGHYDMAEDLMRLAKLAGDRKQISA
jgi:transcriptional regulator with XRE-family HTH domain